MALRVLAVHDRVKNASLKVIEEEQQMITVTGGKGAGLNNEDIKPDEFAATMAYGKRLLRTLRNEWTVVLLQDPNPKLFLALSAPRTLFVTSGVLEGGVDEDQLAMLISQEMAHFMHGHIIENHLHKRLGIVLWLSVMAFMDPSGLSEFLLESMLIPYYGFFFNDTGHDEVREYDSAQTEEVYPSSFATMVAAKYDARAGVSVFEKSWYKGAMGEDYEAVIGQNPNAVLKVLAELELRPDRDPYWKNPILAWWSS